MSFPPRDLEKGEEEIPFNRSNELLVHDLSIRHDYLLLDISDDKDFMAVLTKEWELIVYTLKHTNDGIKYVGNPIRYEVMDIDSIQDYYMYLSVASETGDVAISFAELENPNTPLFTTKTPQQVCRYCLVYSKKRYGDVPKKIEFQGRAVYVEEKLVLIGGKILEVRYADTLKLKYFLDLNYLGKGFEPLLAGETFVKQATWAKYFPTRPSEINNDRDTITGLNDAENTTRMINDGDKLILMTRHIHSNTLVTNYRGNIVRLWSILDGSLLALLATKETEYVMAISGDQRFVATYEKIKKEVNVYCTKSNLLLHTYLPREKQTDRSDFSVTCVRFYSYRPYIVIAGIRKDPGVTGTSQNNLTAFYEVWSIYQERLIQSREEPGICDKALQPFALEWIPDYREEKEEVQSSESGSSESESSISQPVLNISNKASGSNTRQLTAKFNRTTSGSNQSTKLNSECPPLYGVFSKQIGSNIVFGNILVFEYNRKPAGMKPELIHQIDWQGFPFQMLGGEVFQQKPLSDICEPLDGANTLGYVSDHASGVYLLRFGTHMVQLWQLTKIPEEEEVNAETAGFIFNFRNVSRSSGGKYYNTIQHSQLKFARAYKGYHNDDLSSFRDVWKSYGSNIHFMSDEGHILVDIKKFPKRGIFTYGYQQPNTSVQRNPNWLKKLDGKIRDFFSDNSKSPKQAITITEDEFFLPLPQDGSSNTDYEFCEIESAIQALHHLGYVKFYSTDRDYRKDIFETNKDHLYEKISLIINKALESPNCSRYFSTYSGNRTLVLLASFERGQDVIFDIIAKKIIPINIFSYSITEKAKENVLTVLVQQHKYELFKLFYNKLLVDYYAKVPINLFPLMDVLFCLQDEDLPDLLINCVQKLSNIPANSSEKILLDYQDEMHNDCFTTCRNITKYNVGGIISILLYKINNYPGNRASRYNMGEPLPLIDRLLERNKRIKEMDWEKKNRNRDICIAPLPSSDIYEVLSYVSGVDNDVLLSLGIADKENNSFKEDYPLIEVLISYRWRTSTRFRFYIISFIHLLHYVFYTVSVSFPEETFFYIPGEKISHPGHKASIAVMITCDVLIFWQEVLQMKAFSFSYFKSFYNYVDLAACIFPVASFAILVNNSSYLYEVSSITTLILWIHFILRSRILRSMGNLVQLIIELGKRTFPIFVTMILVVLAFTNSFIVLLRRQDDSFFQEQYGGNSTPANENVTVGISHITTSDQSQQNLFTDVFLAFTSVWLFIYGEFDPILSGNAGNYPMAIILLVLFTFITSLIILNVVIAVMTGAIDNTTKRGNRNWYSHFAAVVAEIEIFFGFFYKKDEPMNIYYYSRRDVIWKQKDKIIEEYERLKMKLLLNNED